MSLEALLQTSARCFHRAKTDPDELLDALAELRGVDQILLRHVRGTKMGSPRQLFDEWAAALQFPPYFGENWSAFDECLNDLDWLPPGPCVLVILDADFVLDRATDDELDTFARILRDTAAAWNGGRAFHVVLQWAPEACEPALSLNLRRLGVRAEELEL